MVIKKIESTPEKDNSGAIKVNPISKKKIMKQKVVEEAININLIKGIRPFHKSKGHKSEDEEIQNQEISVFYMDGSTEGFPVEIRVLGNWKEHIDEVNRLHGNPKLTTTTHIPSE